VAVVASDEKLLKLSNACRFIEYICQLEDTVYEVGYTTKTKSFFTRPEKRKKVSSAYRCLD
jgi:hypothetical protein